MASPTVTVVVYPDSDGEPMSDNTVQFRYINVIEGGLEAMFRNRPDVFVAGNLLWYPVEGRPEVCTGPDVLVVFGRPKDDRGSYKQWEEGGIAPQVVFEIVSPSNRPLEMARKVHFYRRYGVEEYYLFDPDTGELAGYVRDASQFSEVPDMHGFISPRLGIRFEVVSEGLRLFRPDGRQFTTYAELDRERDEAVERADRLAAKLRQLGIDPDA